MAAGSVRIVYRLVQDQEADIPVSFQIGVAVGKSTGSAVMRNRIKRIILESIRLNQNVLHGFLDSQEELFTAMVIFRGNGSDLSGTPRDVVRCLEDLKREFNK